MHYLLLIHEDETRYSLITEEQHAEILAEYDELADDMRSAGVLRAAHRLRPTTTATTVRVREEGPVTTDGPFAETKEQLGGYILIEADDLDEALAWAAKVPSARSGCIEVRPIWIQGDEI